MATAAPLPRTSAPAAQVQVAQRCTLVGRTVLVTGSGFSGGAPYELAVDGVDFGQSLTNPAGAFANRLSPGGLGAGQAQITDSLTASDGSSTASTRFTLTRPTGALFGAGRGSSPRRRVPFQVWDFAPTGPRVRVYLHYLAPGGRLADTVELGLTSGQCGALISRRELFPFSPRRGTWTLRLDTYRTYTHPRPGPAAQIRVTIR